MEEDSFQLFCAKDQLYVTCDNRLLRDGGFLDGELSEEPTPDVHEFSPVPLWSWAVKMTPMLLERLPYDVPEDCCIGVLEVAHFFSLADLQDYCLASLARKVSSDAQEVKLDAEIQSLDYDLQLDLLDHILDLDGCGWTVFKNITSRLHIVPSSSQIKRHAVVGTTMHLYRGCTEVYLRTLKVKFSASMECYSVEEDRVPGGLSNLYMWDLSHLRPSRAIPRIVDATMGPAGYMYITTECGKLQVLPNSQSELMAGEELGWRACVFATSTVLVALPTHGLQALFDRHRQDSLGRMWVYMESDRWMRPVRFPFPGDTRWIEFAPNHEFVVHASIQSLKISRYVNEELQDTTELVDMRKIETWNGVEAGDLVHVAISPDSTSVAVIYGKEISVWRIAPRIDSCADIGMPRPMLTTHAIPQPDFKVNGRPVCLTYSPDCRFLAFVWSCGQIDIFRNHGVSMTRAASVDCLFKISPKERSHSSFVKSVAWSPYEDLLAIGLDCGIEPVAISKYLKSS